jgi:hypothetical protein
MRGGGAAVLGMLVGQWVDKIKLWWWGKWKSNGHNVGFYETSEDTFLVIPTVKSGCSYFLNMLPSTNIFIFGSYSNFGYFCQPILRAGDCRTMNEFISNTAFCSHLLKSFLSELAQLLFKVLHRGL